MLLLIGMFIVVLVVSNLLSWRWGVSVGVERERKDILRWTGRE